MGVKAVLYARVSSREQEDTGYSLPAQEKLLREYAARKGLEVVKVFSVAESASGAKQRKVFAEMMSYMSRNGVSHLLCEKVDRLTRNLKEAVVANDWIEEDDKRQLHFVKQNLVIHQDAKSDEKFRWDIEIVLAKKFIANLSEEVKKGQKEKIAQGWLPTKAPLGYRTHGEKGHKVHVIDTEKAPLVRKMFELYASGTYSVQHLSQVMYTEGLRSRNGYRVVRSRLASLLADPFYMGKIVWNDEVYEGKQEALVSRDTFERVQSILKAKTNSSKHRRHTYLFKGLVHCHDCGGLVTWEAQKGIVYGHCSQYRKCTKRKWFKEKDFVTAIGQELHKLSIQSPRLAEWVRKALKEIHKTEIEYRDSAMQEQQNQLIRLRQRKETLYTDRLDGRITPETYDIVAHDIDETIQEVTNGIKRHSEAEKGYYELGIDIFELAQQAAQIFAQSTPEKQRKLLNLVCEEIYVTDNTLVVKFSEAFNLLAHVFSSIPASSKSLKTVPSPYQIFELTKDGSIKARKDVTDSALNPLLRG